MNSTDPPASSDRLYDLLMQAATHHQAGRFAQADAAYCEALRLDPENRDAHHNLGVLAMQTGKGVQVALPHFRKAWEIDPSHAQHGFSYLRALILSGDLEEARRVQTDGARRGLPWPSVETILGQAGPRRSADAALQPAGEPAPAEQAELARAFAAGDLPRIEALGRSLAQRFREWGPAWKALGVAAAQSGHRDEAILALRTAARLLPKDAETFGFLGSALLDAGVLGEAEASLRQALALNPGFAAFRGRLGDALATLSRFTEAEAEYRQALSLRPDYADACCGLGLALQGQALTDEALASYRQALALQPGHRRAYAGAGAILLQQGRLNESEALCREVLSRDPSRADVHYDLGTLLTKQGRIADAEASYSRVVALAPDHLEARSSLLFLRHYRASVPADALFEESKAFGAAARRKASAPFTTWTCGTAPDRLRVGLVSGDLRDHPVGHFLQSVLEAAAPERIDWVAFATHPESDVVSTRLRSRMAEWHSLAGLSDEAAARLIHGGGIHVLLDLSGHTAFNRLPVFAWRPAPVQASWLGYFATTGLAEMDFLLADRVGVTKALERFFTERIWYLPETRLCFTPPGTDLLPAPAPCLANGFVTFGCFQSLPKVTDAVLRAWGRILAACEGARLWLQNPSLGDAGVASALRDRLLAAGIDAARVRLHAGMPREEYLRAYAEVDLVLDTFPYPGGTTTCEALWMGVPTLSLAGDSMIARQGASLLSAAGLPDWVVGSTEDYVARAVSLAADAKRLAALRRGLREQVMASPLFDARRFAGNLGDALWGMWRLAGARNGPPGPLLESRDDAIR